MTELCKRTRILTGLRFGRWSVGEFVEYRKEFAIWRCTCECGTVREVIANSLLTGASKSCGCILRDRITTHGMTKTKEFKAYGSAKDRCTNPNLKNYLRYGGRGIEFRFESFEQFLETVGMAPGKQYTLDRIDNNGHYEPGNCRWVTMMVQSRNRRNNRTIEIDGVAMPIIDVIHRSPVGYTTVMRRISRGWPNDKAFMTPCNNAGTPTHKTQLEV